MNSELCGCSTYIMTCVFVSLRFEHYRAMHDVQTLAMLSCIFQLHCNQFSLSQGNSLTVTSFSFSSSLPLPPPPPARSPPTSHRGGPGPQLSSSWHDIGSNFPSTVNNGSTPQNSSNVEDDERDQEEKTHLHNCFLLDKLLVQQGDEYRRCYANILYHWQLLEQRAEVIKLQSTSSEDHTRIGE